MIGVINGFQFVSGQYFVSDDGTEIKNGFLSFFDKSIQQDPFSDARKRAYLKLNYSLKKGEVKPSENQSYFQTSYANNMDGGKHREFYKIPEDFIESKIFQLLLKKNTPYIKKHIAISDDPEVTLGIHFVRYEVCENRASYSSPAWLHIDNEPLVFVHLVNLTDNTIGGDNIIASNEIPTNVIRLENFLDTIILDKSVQHAVTPMGSRSGIANRDVILFTIEEECQQDG